MSVTEWRGNALLCYWCCVSSSVECRVCSLLSPRKPVVVQHTECVQGFGGVTVGAPSYFLHTTVGFSCSCSVCWPARLLCFRLASLHNTVSLWPSYQFSQAEIPNFAASVFQTGKICLFCLKVNKITLGFDLSVVQNRGFEGVRKLYLFLEIVAVRWYPEVLPNDHCTKEASFDWS